MSPHKTTRHALHNGPWRGERIYLDSDGDGCTGWVVVNGIPGRYRRGRWEPITTTTKGKAP